MLGKVSLYQCKVSLGTDKGEGTEGKGGRIKRKAKKKSEEEDEEAGG